MTGGIKECGSEQEKIQAAVGQTTVHLEAVASAEAKASRGQHSIVITTRAGPGYLPYGSVTKASNNAEKKCPYQSSSCLRKLVVQNIAILSEYMLSKSNNQIQPLNIYNGQFSLFMNTLNSPPGVLSHTGREGFFRIAVSSSAPMHRQSNTCRLVH